MNDPNYYAVIPSSVRYSKELTANAKLLYGEITALCNKEGFCWATNRYFAELYNVSADTVSRWISQLEKAGFIRSVVMRNTNNEVEGRKIWITNLPAELQGPLPSKSSIPSPQNHQYNNTSINTTRRNKEKRRSAPKKETIMGTIDNEELREAIYAFIEHRKQMKRPMTDRGIQLLMKKLDSIADTIEEQIAVLEQSIMNGWQGVFPLKGSFAISSSNKNYEQPDNSEFLSMVENDRAETMRLLGLAS